MAELHPDRDLSREPIFQAIFALQNFSDQHFELAGLEWSSEPIEHPSAQFNLSLHLFESREGLKGYFEYAMDLFERATVERLASRLRVLLEGIAADADRVIWELPLLGPGEREQLLVGWNETAAEYACDRCIHELIAEQARSTPDAIALQCGQEQLTYAELEERGNQLGHYLRGLGVGPEVIVGLCVERSAAMVVGLLGILKAGGAYLPLEPDAPPERLAFMLEDTGAKVLVTVSSTGAKRGRRLGADVPRPRSRAERTDRARGRCGQRTSR